MTSKLGRLYYYFRRGHSTYTAFILSMLNFVMLVLLVTTQILHLPLEYAILVAGIFIVLYSLLVAFIGYLDVKRGQLKVECEIAARVNPWFRAEAEVLSNLIDYLMTGDKTKLEIARKVLEEWQREFKV